jgi:uncharacterized membrane protein YdjX (TVP38/TMEM64 family)
MKKRVIAAIVIFACILAYTLSLLLPSAEQLITQPSPTTYAIYVLLIITEVIIAPIPGGVLALVGAANFGFFPAWGLNYLGNVIGAQIAFVLARKFGRPLVDRLVKKGTQKRYYTIVSGHTGFAFFAYAFPFFPIDILSFLFGLSAIKHKKFFTITSIGLISNSAAYAYLGSRFGVYVPYLQEISLSVFVLMVLLIGYWAYIEFNKKE